MARTFHIDTRYKGETVNVHAQMLGRDGNPIANAATTPFRMDIFADTASNPIASDTSPTVEDSVNAWVLFSFSPGDLSSIKEGTRYMHNIWSETPGDFILQLTGDFVLAGSSK